MPENYNYFNLMVDENGLITNIDYLIDVINMVQYSPEDLDRLNNLYLNVTTNNYPNKEALETALAKKVTEFNIMKQAEDNQKNLLNTLKESNASIRNQIRLITTSHDENKNNKAETYIEYIDPDTKEVSRIHTDNPEAMNNFIKAHANEIGEWTAKQIFEYFAKYVNVTVEKYDPNEFLNNSQAVNHSSLENPDDINYQRRLIEEYARRTNDNYNPNDIKIVTDNLSSIDTSPDEILWTTDGKNLLKFVETANGLRLEQLSDGLEPTKEEQMESDDLGISGSQEHETLEEIDNEDRHKLDADTLDQLDPSQKLNMEDLNQLLEKREALGSDFAFVREDVIALYTQASLAMDALEQSLANGEDNEELYNAVCSFMDPIIHQINYFGDESLNHTDANYYQRFYYLNEQYQIKHQEVLKEQREKGLAPKQLVLKKDPHHPNNRNGLINLIIILEAVLLTGIVISIIALLNS